MKKKIDVKDNVENVSIADVLKNDYMLYSASSLTRMLPHCIDGLKPVQRRILYTMWEMKVWDFTKSADVVGRTMQYAPHGDAAIYDAMVVLAQADRVKNRYIIGQGNFGYITDSLKDYAAPRYTEVKLSDYARDFFFTEDFLFTETMTTYKGIPSIREPVVFPSLLPLGLVQGSKGITPGFSNHIIPHSLAGLAKSYIYYIKNRENIKNWSKLEKYILDNMTIDFPNKCKILTKSEKGLLDGKGQIAVEGDYRILDGKRGKVIIQIFQLPYLVSAPAFVESVKQAFAKDDNYVGISDESSKDGILINITFKKETSVPNTLVDLRTKTPFLNKYNYSFIMNKGGVPKRMGIIEIFETHYRYKKSILEAWLTTKEKELREKKLCLDGAIYILKDPKRRAEFIKMLENSDKNTIIKNIKIKWNLEPFVAEYLINRKFSTLLGKVEDITLELEKVTKEYDITKENLSDIDKYLIKEIKAKVKKYDDRF